MTIVFFLVSIEPVITLAAAASILLALPLPRGFSRGLSCALPLAVLRAFQPNIWDLVPQARQGRLPGAFLTALRPRRHLTRPTFPHENALPAWLLTPRPRLAYPSDWLENETEQQLTKDRDDTDAMGHRNCLI